MGSRKRRLLTAIVLAVASSVALAACGGGSGGGGSDDGGKVTLHLVGTSDTQAAATKVIQDFEESHPNITIKSSFPTTDQYITATRAQLGGANAPDLLEVFPGGGNAMTVRPLVQAGVLADLTDQKWVASIPPTFKKEVSVDGKTYFYPLSFDMIGLAYDKKYFQKLGIEPPTTFSGLLDLCKSLSQKGVTPMAVGMKETFVPQFISYAMAPSLVYAKDPNFDASQAAGKASFSDSGWQQIFDEYVAMWKGGCFNKGFNGTSWPDMLGMIATNKAAMGVSVTEGLPEMRKDNPSGQFAMVPFPATDDRDKNWVPAGLSVGFGITAKSDHQDAAKQFLDFVNSPKESAVFATALGNVSIGEDPEIPEGVDAMIGPYEQGRFSSYPDHAWPDPQVQATHNAVLQQLFTNQISPQEALKKMDESYRNGS